MRKQSVVLGAESLAAGKGGICRVARLMGKVLAEEIQAGRLCGQAIVYSDPTAAELSGLSVYSAGGSRLGFVARIQRAQVSHSHFIYDFLGMARAHLLLPLPGRPLMVFIHGIEVWEGTPANRLKTASKATYLVSNSAYTRQRAGRLFPGFNPARVCWLATEEDDVPGVARQNAGPPTVLIVGRMDKAGYKGHKELIEGWPKVVASVPPARLLIVGEGPGRQEYQQLAGKLPCATQIQFTGFVPEAKMPALWSSADVFAMPSRGEGFGLVYIEAMRQGIPVIASIHDAAPEINIHGQTGFNVNLDQPDDLPEKLIQLLQNRQQALALGRTGQERWRQHFCYSAFRERFKPILWDFLGGRS